MTFRGARRRAPHKIALTREEYNARKRTLGHYPSDPHCCTEKCDDRAEYPVIRNRYRYRRMGERAVLY
jgi:hypothetical protein